MPIAEEARLWREAMLARVASARLVRARARVLGVGGWMVRTGPMPAQIGEAVVVQGLGRGWRRAVVAGAEEAETRLLLLEGAGDLRPGLHAEALGQQLSVPVGEGLAGRVLDPLGRPLDGGPTPAVTRRRAVLGTPPAPMERRGAWQPLATGVRVLDGLLTCARGQRLGVIGPAGSGKTTLLRMAAAHARADVVVLALVGERGREVFEAAGDLLSRERPLVVVASSPYDPPALRLMTAHAATAIAEDFRDQGAHVFLAVDSLTRLAHAQREIGLALGELPVTRAYPPSVFGLIPQLIERAGPAARGAITAFYSLLTEGDDLVDPVAEVAMASLDGQVVLARRLANQGLYPAVDLLRSLSRLMPEVVDPDQRRSAAQVRRLLQAYEEARDLVDAGLYRPGANGDVDRALRLMPRLLAFIAQTPSETSEPPATRRQVLLMAGLD